MIVKLRELRRLIIAEAKRLPRHRRAMFLRFGDPRKVAGRSMIHDPQVVADAEEMLSWDPDGQKQQQYEDGISAYVVDNASNGRCDFRIPPGVSSFYAQVNGFLLERIINDDAYMFFGEPVGRGTDGEPVIDQASITRVNRIPVSALYADRKKLTDMVDSWTLMRHHDMGYDEFFKTSSVTEDRICKYVDRVEASFTTPKQISAMEEIRDAWLSQLREETGKI